MHDTYSASQEFFSKLSALEERFGGGADGWTSTHPSTHDRKQLTHDNAPEVERYCPVCHIV